MKNVKKKEQINRPIPIIPARYLSIILILIFVVLGTIASAEQTNKLEARDSWKEIKLILNAYYSVWCDSRHIAFSGKSNKGIRIYDVDSGIVQDITNDPSHENVSCAADGRYIVFTNDVFGKNKQGSLFVYDRSTKNIKKMYDMESILLKEIDKTPLSPNANYLLGPNLPRGRKYILPGGKEVKLVPYRKGMISTSRISTYQWSFDESRLFLFDPGSGKVTIHSLEDNRDRQLSFGRNLNLGVMHITKDSKLYADIIFGEEIGDNSVTNLYIFDLNNPDKKRKVLVSDIEWYDADDEGNIVFSKRSKKGHFICYLKRGGQQPQILKEVPVPHNIGIWPRIAKDGKAVFYSIPTTQRGVREYTILIKN